MNTIQFTCSLVCIFSIFFSFHSPLRAQSPVADRLTTTSGFFIENKGQWPEEVLYLTRIGGMEAWISRGGITYDFYNVRKTEAGERESAYERIGQVVRQELVGSNSLIAGKGLHGQERYLNYFLGDDPSRWASEVKLYEEVILSNVYEDIDQRVYVDAGRLRYDFIVHPGGDPAQIKFRIEGASEVSIGPDGELVLQTRLGEVTHRDLNVYQSSADLRIPVSASWKMEGDLIHYEVGAYDESRDLVIDPLIYATFLGGTGIERANSVVVDEAGNAFIAGTHQNNGDFPVTTGAYDVGWNAGFDVIVSRISANGTVLAFSTYLGGGEDDQGLSIALDSAGNVVVAGDTRSGNFPVTPSSYDQTFNGTVDAFVARLSDDGTQLLQGTYLGGGETDRGNAIALDDTGNVYLTGSATSFNFPTTFGAFDRTINSGGNFSDVFVAKLGPDLDTLVFGTFIGGSVFENAVSIALDSQNNVYLTGVTASSDYPTTSGVVQAALNSSPTNPGMPDAFVTKLSSDGSQLMYSTFIGGTEPESAWSIAVDTSGSAFVAGTTQSADFPTTAGAYQQIRNGTSDAYVIKLNADATSFMYASYLGGNGAEIEPKIRIDSLGFAYVGGTTESSDLTASADAISFSNSGESDVFISRINPTGSAISYLTYFGGAGTDNLGDLEIDGAGNVWMAGRTGSADFPITSGAIQSAIGDVLSEDAFVAKLKIDFGSVSIEPDLEGVAITIYPNPTSGQFFLELPNEIAEFQLDIVDAMGRWVYGEKGVRSAEPIQVDLPDGLYTVRIQSDEQQYVRKIQVKR